MLRSSGIFHSLARIFKDLQSSCQDLQGSFIFFPRSLRIFHFPVKILELSGSPKTLKILYRSLKIPWGSSKFSLRSLKISHFLTYIGEPLYIRGRGCAPEFRKRPYKIIKGTWVLSVWEWQQQISTPIKYQFKLKKIEKSQK